MKKIKGRKVTDRQADVYAALAQFPDGAPDHALVPLAQHVSGVHQSSSGIRSRRSELCSLGLVKANGRTKMPSGRFSTVWKVR